MAELPIVPSPVKFDNVNLKSLPLDPIQENYTRPVAACFSRVMPTPLDNPTFVAVDDSALRLIDLDAKTVTEHPDYVQVFTGNKLLEGSEPNSHCYCGHQFGSFAGQLGDGRAISLGEVINKNGERWEVQLKGAGKTPYSRFADGRAVLRSSIREFLCSEHMHALGVPTTRAGTLVVSDTLAVRDPMYSGREILEKCAVVSRIAPTFFRFGSWEIFKPLDIDREGPCVNKKEYAPIMLDHVIKYHFQDLHRDCPDEGQRREKYLKFFEEVVVRTARMVAEWQLVGFTHGVLNTDNMSILGLTIDYGPFGFLDKYNPKFVPNTTDEGGRYRFEAQPSICKWNLTKFAEGLSVCMPLNEMKEIIKNAYDSTFKSHYLQKLRKKLGLIRKVMPEDVEVFDDFFTTLGKTQADFTNAFRSLSKVIPVDQDNQEQVERSNALMDDLLNYLVKQSGSVKDVVRTVNAPYNWAQIESLKLLQRESPQTYRMLTGGQEGIVEMAEEALVRAENIRKMSEDEKKANDREHWKKWLDKYAARVNRELEEAANEYERNQIKEQRLTTMTKNNPKFILRNYVVQNAIKKAEGGDYSEVRKLHEIMTTPFDEHEGVDLEMDLGTQGQIPEWACNSVLSCSS